MKLEIHILLILSAFAIITSCSSNKKEILVEEDSPAKEIKIRSSDISMEEIGDFLVLDSYIILSNDEIIGAVERSIMDKDKIYLLDNTHRVFCYDMKGNLVFMIDRRGQGPQEYVQISDFGIDFSSNRLFIYDDNVRKIFVFDKQTGNYVSEFSTRFMLPDKFGVVDGVFFFDNADDRRIGVNDETLKYFLLYSETGTRIDGRFFPHDAIAGYYFGGGEGHPFFYNDDKLLYNKVLSSRVHVLRKNGISALCDIFLPNQLPMKLIEEKIEIWDVVRSDYSWCLSDIFLSDSVLHFVFSKDGFINTCYYDLASDKILFCGPKVLDTVRENLPFYSLIDGVFDGKFYTLIPATEVIRQKESHPELFQEDLKNVQPEDNYVVAFYKILR
jgi:hypothetical protein